MAVTSKGPDSKEDKLGRSLKERLDKLGCPYTEDVEYSWISELVFKPGEPRIRILQWLFSKFDSTLGDALNTQHKPVGSKMDSRLQRLLHVASSLGLCQYDNVDLIRGVTGGAKQRAFIDLLLDLVCEVDSAEDPQTKPLAMPGIVSDSMKLSEQFRHDCAYVDKLVSQEKMGLFFNKSVTLLPPDIARQVETGWMEKGFSKDKPPLPDVHVLADSYAQLLEQLTRQKEILQELSQSYPYQGADGGELVNVSRTLRLALSELSQLTTGFMYNFENEIRPWCNKTRPELTDLGPALKRVHYLLQQLRTLQGSLKSIRKDYRILCEDTKDRVDKLQANKSHNDLVDSTMAAADNFQKYILLLEESTLHKEDSFTSPALSFT